jgi:transcriptional regulator with GAF, ATPase, and Fis domain
MNTQSMVRAVNLRSGKDLVANEFKEDAISEEAASRHEETQCRARGGCTSEPRTNERGSFVKSSETIAYPGRGQAERAFDQIIGNSPALESVLEQVERVASTDSTVLIQGETGTGKELIARAIHNISPRCGRALIKLNCAAIPLDLLESELFGHEKGAFTGAIAQKIGRFEMADKGTLFLDEVGDIPAALQPKLLRVLQEQQFERLGSGRTHQVNVRLIAATNRDLAGMVAQKEFRCDLYYRLNVFPISLPPLRERRKDIPALVEHFVEIFSRRMSRDIRHIPPETMAAFSSYHWPGNIRELQNLVERAVILAQDGALPNPLPTSVVSMARSPSPTIFENSEPPEPMTLRDSERALILRALQTSGWRIAGQKGAAAKLGLNRSTLQFRMKKLGIERTISGGLSDLSYRQDCESIWQESPIPVS